MAVPEAVRPLLEGLVALARTRFPDRLRAVYCLGSVAHGGWSRRLSDVDVCVVLGDPLHEGDGPALVGLSGELAESFPRFGPRLSLFWATEAILKGDDTGGRLGPLEVADLAQNGLLLWGVDVRATIRPLGREELLAAMEADMIDRWERRVTPFAGRDALAAGDGAELDERTLIKACLYPARFLFTAETGRIAGNDAAARSFAERYGEPHAAALRLASEIRDRAQGPDTTPEERECLARAFKPLYALFFAELSGRYGRAIPRA
jgi:hypothetical protein